MTLIAISILNHDRAAATVECVRSLLAQQAMDSKVFSLEIHVADNGSSNDDRNRLEKTLPREPGIHVNYHDTNIGFSAGHNRNVRAILGKGKPDFIWFLNNDCIVLPGAVARLLECARLSPSTAIWGGTLLEADGRTIQCAGGCRYNAWISSFRQLGNGKPIDQVTELTSSRMDYVAGASLFMPATLLTDAFDPVPKHGTGNAQVKPEILNETFFLYFEELDLAQRLKDGYMMGWCREAFIIHAGGKASGTSGDSRRAMAEYHSTLSALKFTRLYYRGRLWFTMPARFVAKIIQLAITLNLRLIPHLVKAYRDFLAER